MALDGRGGKRVNCQLVVVPLDIFHIFDVSEVHFIVVSCLKYQYMYINTGLCLMYSRTCSIWHRFEMTHGRITVA